VSTIFSRYGLPLIHRSLNCNHEVSNEPLDSRNLFEVTGGSLTLTSTPTVDTRLELNPSSQYLRSTAQPQTVSPCVHS
jgi:hypothetical protein